MIQQQKQKALYKVLLWEVTTLQGNKMMIHHQPVTAPQVHGVELTTRLACCFAESRLKPLSTVEALTARLSCIQHAKHPAGCHCAVCMFGNSTRDDGRAEARYVQCSTLCKRSHTCAHESQTLCWFLQKLLYFHFSFFHTFVCVINRREEQASVSLLPMPILHLLSCFFFFPPLFTLQTTVHRIYNRK